MTLVVEQPSYVPWLGYFDLMRQADDWVWYDDVQYTRRDWRNRNRLARAGAPSWVTVPVRDAGSSQLICEVEIDRGRRWERKHLETFRHCCGDAPYFAPVNDLYGDLLARRHELLADLVIALGEAIAGLLGITPRFLRSSRLAGLTGAKDERLLAVCRRLGSRVYLSGPSARAYIRPAAFAAAGVELRYVVYDYPPYARGHLPFVPGLSILDALAWMGPAATSDFLARHGRQEPGEPGPGER